MKNNEKSDEDPKTWRVDESEATIHGAIPHEGNNSRNIRVWADRNSRRVLLESAKAIGTAADTERTPDNTRRFRFYNRSASGKRHRKYNETSIRQQICLHA